MYMWTEVIYWLEATGVVISLAFLIIRGKAKYRSGGEFNFYFMLDYITTDPHVGNLINVKELKKL